MNKYEIMAAQARTYHMLATVTNSANYLQAAKNCIAVLRKMLRDDQITKTYTFELK